MLPDKNQEEKKLKSSCALAFKEDVSTFLSVPFAFAQPSLFSIFLPQKDGAHSMS